MELQGEHLDATERVVVSPAAGVFVALATLDLSEFTHVGKLDGDVELPREWFAQMMERFAEDPKLGVTGGCLVEPEGDELRPLKIPSYHVHGALKTYSREQFMDKYRDQLKRYYSAIAEKGRQGADR